MTYDVLIRARHRTRRWILSAALIVTLVAAVTVAILLAAGSQPMPTSAQPTTRVQSPAAVAGASPDDAMLPSDLTWTDLAGLALPISRQAGPADTFGGLARGFTHDPAGAVLASVNIVARLNPQLDPAIVDATLSHQVVGADSAALRAQLALASTDLRAQAGVSDGQSVGRLSGTVRGYRVVSYGDDQCVVALLTEALDPTGSTVQANTQLRVRWAGSDWALVAPDGGSFDHVVTPSRADDIAAFHPFSAGR